MKNPVLVIILFLSLVGNSFGQSTNKKKMKSFHEQCIGKWNGTMYIYAYGKLQDSILVELNVQVLDSNAWTWKTDHRSEKLPVTKDYILRKDSKNAQTFLLDEGDGVMLTNYIFGDKLYSNIETEGKLLTSSYEFVGRQLIFEVTSGKKLNEAEESGVTNYSVDFVQRVVFRKVK
ncbi:MAG: hypothetical protein ACKOXP_10795 [Flavobacteriales bacterium]